MSVGILDNDGGVYYNSYGYKIAEHEQHQRRLCVVRGLGWYRLRRLCHAFLRTHLLSPDSFNPFGLFYAYKSDTIGAIGSEDTSVNSYGNRRTRATTTTTKRVT